MLERDGVGRKEVEERWRREDGRRKEEEEGGGM